MAKELIKIQIGLFFQEDFQGSFREISKEIFSNSNDTIDTKLPPIPNDVPKEIPRLILTFNGGNVLNVSKSRIDFF